MMFSHHFPTM